MGYYEGKYAVVTGGANGIGLGLTRELLNRGASVMIADIKSSSIDTAMDELKDFGDRIACCKTDVTKSADWETLANAANQKFGRVDLLFSNAGIYFPKPYPDYSDADWNWYISVNLLGCVKGANVFYPLMAKQDSGGKIIFTASQASVSPGSGLVPYNVTKTALLRYAECFHLEMKAMKLPVSAAVVMPAVIGTQIGTREEDAEVRPVEYAGASSLSKMTEAEVSNFKMLYNVIASGPQAAGYKELANSMGMITTPEAVTRILDRIALDYFYIYTHDDMTRYIITDEVFRMLRSYGEPITQGELMAEYLSKSGEVFVG